LEADMDDRHRPARFTITRDREGAILRIVASGELDLATAPRLREQCEREHPDDAEVILLDLADVTFMDRAGAYALLAAHEHCDERLAIVLSPPCARVIESAGLRDRLPIVATTEIGRWRQRLAETLQRTSTWAAALGPLRRLPLVRDRRRASRTT
jgi:anti-anti-sigma factor